MQKRPWLRRAGAALLLLAAVSAGFSRSLRAGRVHEYLSARLAAAFGRPVEVGQFGFSVFKGLRLQAHHVTVGEDPRFGHEYFLRAERLTAGLRWRSLARGRFEFGTLSFTRPSLNLVRASDGHWNVESWLPPPTPAGIPAPVPEPPGQGPAGTNPPARLYRIEVDAGRINFKRGVDKHPFALIEVTGTLEQEMPGRWRLDLKARPMRVAVALQEAGTLHLRGRIAGTTARLQPVDLALTWQEASLADALRLSGGQDYGMRGRLDVVLAAQSEAGGARWTFTATARLAGVHRWDLPRRPSDPGVNLILSAQWRPGEALVEFRQCRLEAARSNVSIAGNIQWAKGLDPQFRFVSAWLSLGDLLAWYRAFRPGVAADLNLEGNASLDFTLSGWPPRLEQGELASEGASLGTTGLREPIRLGRVAARMRRGRLELEPTTIAFSPGPGAGTQGQTQPSRPGPARKGALSSVAGQADSLRIEGILESSRAVAQVTAWGWPFELKLDGQVSRAQDWLDAAQALGHTINRGWSVEGPAELRLRWQGNLRPFQAQTIGVIELRGLLLRTSYLNQPVSFVNARIDLDKSERRVTLAAATAFGGRWHGTLRWNDPARPWQFDLTVDRLNAADLDRWLGPRARPSLLRRLFPFAGADTNNSELDAALGRVRGQGRLNVEEFVLPPFSLRMLHADAEIDGRKIALQQARAELYKGSLKGSLRAELSAQPVYHCEAEFEGVDLAMLSDATTALKNRFAGAAAGQLTLTARGIGREDLLRSLEGRGTIGVRGPRLRGLDMKAAYLFEKFRPGASQFAAADARFSLAARKIQVESLRLSDRGDNWEAEGSVDFSRTLDLRLHALVRPDEKPAGDPPGKTIRITGPLDAPQISPVESRSGTPGGN